MNNKKVILWDGKNKTERQSTHQEYRLLNAILILGLVPEEVNNFVKHSDCQLVINQSGNNCFDLSIGSDFYLKHLVSGAASEKDAFAEAWELVRDTERQLKERINKYNKFMSNTEVKCCGIYYTYETECDNCGGNPQNLIARS